MKTKEDIKNKSYDNDEFELCQCVKCRRTWRLTANIDKKLLRCPYCKCKAFIIDKTGKVHHDYT